MKYKYLLDNYKSGIENLTNKVKGLSDIQLNYLPERNDSWSIKDHIIHIVDCEVNNFIRLRSIIAQPNSECYVMNEDLWTKNIKHKNESIEDFLSLFKIIRTINYDFLIGEPEGNWTENYFIRKYKGETKHITIKDCIEIYCNHLSFHFDYIDKILSEME